MKYSEFLSSVALVCATIGNDSSVSAHRIHHENFSPDIPSTFVSNIGSSHLAPSIHPLSVSLSSFKHSPPDSNFPYLTASSAKNPLTIAKEFFESNQSIKSDGYKITSYHTGSNGVTHVYLKQIVDGLEVENGDANINIDKYGRVISYGESFYKSKSSSRKHLKMQSSENDGLTDVKKINQIEAVVKFLEYLKIEAPSIQSLSLTTSTSIGGDAEFFVRGVPIALSDIPVSHRFLQNEKGDLVEIWDIQLEMEENWFHGHVSMEGTVLGLMDWVSDASYEVYPLGTNDPLDGERKILKDPYDKEASPHGWHQIGKKKYTTTIGNNVYAQENLDGRVNDDHLEHGRPDGGKSLSFIFDLDLNKEPKDYLNASVTNLFYWNNIMHDLFYKYGFDEKSGNFQEDNHGKGGKGGDAVIANAQDGAGYNNANFATPPDGKPGKMRMYVWNTESPMRDGDLESGIIIHEYGHGISTRLTGGPSNSGCLGWGEAGGMGEGWGDFWATILRMKPEFTRDSNFAMGTYAINKEKGIRKFIYSTDMNVNPSTYGYIKRFDYVGVHAKGEVWAAMLYEVYWNLVDKHGFSLEWFDPGAKDPEADTNLPAGNLVALKLTIDGLKMQPCNPSFVDARNAILEADEVNFGGENFCEIWIGFAKRGLGYNAKKGGNESFDLPRECQ